MAYISVQNLRPRGLSCCYNKQISVSKNFAKFPDQTYLFSETVEMEISAAPMRSKAFPRAANAVIFLKKLACYRLQSDWKVMNLQVILLSFIYKSSKNGKDWKLTWAGLLSRKSKDQLFFCFLSAFPQKSLYCSTILKTLSVRRIYLQRQRDQRSNIKSCQWIELQSLHSQLNRDREWLNQGGQK